MSTRDIQFDEGKFQELQRKATTLKEQADEELKAITNCIKDMNGASDSITQAMYQIGSQFAPRFENLIKSVAALLEAFSDICKQLKNMVSDAVNGLKDAAQRFVNGITVNVEGV